MTAGSRTAEFVAVLPAGASALVRQPNGKTRPLALRDGVLAILVHHQILITTRIGRYSNSATIAPDGQCVPVAHLGCPTA